MELEKVRKPKPLIRTTFEQLESTLQTEQDMVGELGDISPERQNSSKDLTGLMSMKLI